MKPVGIVDIGSSTIKVLISNVENGDFEILAFNEEKAKGIEFGNVIRASLARKVIKDTIKTAESMAGIEPEGYYIAVSNPNLKSFNEKVELTISETPEEITEEHLETLKKGLLEKVQEKGYEVIHTVPRYFILDGEKYIEPLDLIASKVEAEYHVVEIPTTIKRNLEKLLTQIGFKPLGVVFSSLVAKEAVLDEEDLENNILILDLGSSSTGYVFLKEGSPYISGVIRKGGKALTEALMANYMIPFSEAERIKVEYGLLPLISEEIPEEINVRGKDGKEVQVNTKFAAEILEKNIEEILASVLEELYKRNVNIDYEIQEIVLVGGGALLPGLKEFLSYSVNLPVRLGLPGTLSENEKLNSPIYASLLGGMKYISQIWETNEPSLFGLDIEENNKTEEIKKSNSEVVSQNTKGNIFTRFFKAIKNIFSEE
jgi:cell division protein FtsA